LPAQHSSLGALIAWLRCKASKLLEFSEQKIGKTVCEIYHMCETFIQEIILNRCLVLL